MPTKEYYWKNRDKCLANSRRWTKDNAEKRRESGRKWRQINPERYRVIQRRSARKWKKAHPEQFKEMARKSNKKSNSIRKLLVFQILGNKCVYENEYCSGPLEREHKQPLNRKVAIGGGPQRFDLEVLAGIIDDKQLACHHHNNMKNNSTHEQFIKDCKATYLAYERANPVPLMLS